MAEMSNERPQSKSIQRYAESIDLEGCQLPEAQKLAILMQPLDIHENGRPSKNYRHFMLSSLGKTLVTVFLYHSIPEDPYFERTGSLRTPDNPAGSIFRSFLWRP